MIVQPEDVAEIDFIRLKVFQDLPVCATGYQTPINKGNFLPVLIPL
jgi:hypothetical protein